MARKRWVSIHEQEEVTSSFLLLQFSWNTRDPFLKSLLFFSSFLPLLPLSRCFTLFFILSFLFKDSSHVFSSDILVENEKTIGKCNALQRRDFIINGILKNMAIRWNIIGVTFLTEYEYLDYSKYSLIFIISRKMFYFFTTLRKRKLWLKF